MQIHFRPVAVLTSLLKVMLRLDEDFQHDAIKDALEDLRYFSCGIARTITVQLCTKEKILKDPPVAERLENEFHSDMVKKPQSMIAQWTMEIFPG